MVIWTGSKNTKVLVNKICTLNFILLSVILVFAIINMHKCFSCLQLIVLFIITGNLLTFSMYIFLFNLIIVSTHLVIAWPNSIIWLTLTIFSSTHNHCTKKIKSISVFKSDNNSPGCKHSGQFPDMQSFEVEWHVCVNQIVTSAQ